MNTPWRIAIFPLAIKFRATRVDLSDAYTKRVGVNSQFECAKAMCAQTWTLNVHGLNNAFRRSWTKLGIEPSTGHALLDWCVCVTFERAGRARRERSKRSWKPWFALWSVRTVWGLPNGFPGTCDHEVTCGIGYEGVWWLIPPITSWSNPPADARSASEPDRCCDGGPNGRPRYTQCEDPYAAMWGMAIASRRC